MKTRHLILFSVAALNLVSYGASAFAETPTSDGNLSSATQGIRATENLIENGDFSKGLEGWNATHYEGNPGNPRVINSTLQDGPNAPKNFVKIDSLPYGNINQYHDIDPNTTYKVSFVARAHDSNSGGNSWMQLREWNGAPHAINEDIQIEKTGQWKNYSMLINAKGEHNTALEVGFYANNYQDLEVGNVKLEKISENTTSFSAP